LTSFLNISYSEQWKIKGRKAVQWSQLSLL
jgi:hypothetical protein